MSAYGTLTLSLVNAVWTQADVELFVKVVAGFDPRLSVSHPGDFSVITVGGPRELLPRAGDFLYNRDWSKGSDLDVTP